MPGRCRDPLMGNSGRVALNMSITVEHGPNAGGLADGERPCTGLPGQPDRPSASGALGAGSGLVGDTDSSAPWSGFVKARVHDGGSREGNFCGAGLAAGRAAGGRSLDLAAELERVGG